MATLPSAPYYRFRYRVTLSDTEYLFKFNYATFSGVWTLSIAARDDSEDIVTGLVLAYGLDLLAPHQHLIKGSLLVRPPAGQDASRPAFADMAEGMIEIAYAPPAPKPPIEVVLLPQLV